MPSDNKELEHEILKACDLLDMGWNDHYHYETRENLKALIADQCRLAVIQELELHAPEWVEINEDGTINPSVIYDRIKLLENKND